MLLHINSLTNRRPKRQWHSLLSSSSSSSSSSLSLSLSLLLLLLLLFRQKEKTNSGYKHNDKVSHGIFNLTFRMLQHKCSEVTVTKSKSFFPYKDRFNRSQKSKIVYKASCWDCDAFYIGKTKRRLHDRKTEHFKALTQIGHASAVAEHSISTGHNIKWDHFEILASGSM